MDNVAPERFQVGIQGDAFAPLSDIRRGFRAGYVFELQDLRNLREPLAVHVLALNPRRYTLSEPFQSTLTPTEDNTVVAEENGQIVRELTIEGTMGLTRKRGPAFSGDQGPLEGNEHFHHLRNLFRRYSDLKKDPREAAHIRMVFHSLRDDDHFVVVPRSFDTPRDARTTRVHYEYTITLAVIANADNTLVPLNLRRNFDFFASELGTVAALLNDGRAAFADVAAQLSTVKRKVANIQSVMIQAAGLINAVGNVFRGAGDLVLFPFQLTASVLEQVDNAADTLINNVNDATVGTEARINRELMRISRALDGIASLPELFGPSPLTEIEQVYRGETALTSSDLENDTAGASIGSRTRTTVGTGRDAGLDLGVYSGVRRERVSATDTIESLAVRFDSSPELIILINALRFPYLAEGGGPGVLAPGDAILIPVREETAGLDTSPRPADEYLTAEEAIYGVDLALDPDELERGVLDIRVEDTRSLLDADLARGLDNVIQGTEISVRTERGSTVYVPEVGIRRAVGIKGTIQHLLLAALYLREALLSDPRIEAIQDSTVLLDGDVLTQEISPRLVGQRAVTLVLPVGRASGEGG